MSFDIILHLGLRCHLLRHIFEVEARRYMLRQRELESIHVVAFRHALQVTLHQAMYRLLHMQDLVLFFLLYSREIHLLHFHNFVIGLKTIYRHIDHQRVLADAFNLDVEPLEFRTVLLQIEVYEGSDFLSRLVEGVLRLYLQVSKCKLRSLIAKHERCTWLCNFLSCFHSY